MCHLKCSVFRVMCRPRCPGRIFKIRRSTIFGRSTASCRSSFQTWQAKKTDNTPCFNNNRISPLQENKRSPAAYPKPLTGSFDTVILKSNNSLENALFLSESKEGTRKAGVKAEVFNPQPQLQYLENTSFQLEARNPVEQRSKR